MIVRIQGEGQLRLPDSAYDEINALDVDVDAALANDGDFTGALTALLDAVRRHGVPLADDELLESDVILPASDASADEVRAMLNDDGLIPG